MKNQSAPWGDVLFYENPGDEVYFGEVYRTALQEAWLPTGAEEWGRAGKTRRGRRPTQQGVYARSPTTLQEEIRVCFLKCVEAWREIPWSITPEDPCSEQWSKEDWYEATQEAGVPCGYYDYYIRICQENCLQTGCIPNEAYCFVWDPANPEVAPCGSSLTVSVIGGVPPYDWTIEGDDFSLRHSQTTTPSNEVLTESPCCGQAVITVTDSCDRVCTGSLETPDLGWILRWSGYADRGDPPFCRHYDPGKDYETRADKFKWLFPGSLRMCSMEKHFWPEGLDPDWYPPCGSPEDCAGGECIVSPCYGCPPCPETNGDCQEPCALPATFQYHHMSVYEYQCP